MKGWKIKSVEGMPAGETFCELVDLNLSIFPPSSKADPEKSREDRARGLREHLEGRRHILTLLAYEGGQLVAFKLGFMERKYYFESWQGGVVAQMRRRGISSELMERQHAWCAAKGFRIITTITESENVPMTILNLRHGFRIVGTFFDRGQNLKLTLQKRLDVAS